MTCPTNKPKILTFGDVPATSKPEESRGTNGKRRKQAGAELGQAQPKLELDLGLLNLKFVALN